MQLSKKHRLFIAFSTIFICACKINEPLSLQIAHLNDTHSHFDEQALALTLPDQNGQPVPTYTYVGGYPRLTTKIKQLRESAALNEKAFIALHAGDAFTGTLFFTLFKGQLNADFMNLMQIDAMALGNHEFDLGNEHLAEFSRSVNFPLLSANTHTQENDPLHSRYLPFTIKIINDHSVAIVGLTTAYTDFISSPSENTTFIDEIKAAKETVSTLKNAGVSKIIFVTHVGLALDKLLAQSVSGIDLIIGGHSHDLMGNHTNIGLGDNGDNPIMVLNPQGDRVCITQSGKHAMALGVTDIEFTAKGDVESCNSQNTVLVGEGFAQGTPPQPVDLTTHQVIVDTISQANNIEITMKHQQAQTMLDKAKLEVLQFSSTIVGEAQRPLYHVRLPGDLHPEQGAIENGSMVAPHVARSMADKMQKLTGLSHIAMINAGGIRSELSETISVGNGYEVLPFSSSLVTMTVSGKSLQQTLQTTISNAYALSSVAFPYTNLKFTLDLSKSSLPIVSDIFIRDESGEFQVLNLEAQYRLVTTSYLAGGGDLYSFVDAADITDTGHIDAEVFLQYIESQDDSVLQLLDSDITIIKPQ